MYIDKAIEVLKIEAEGILGLIDKLGPGFNRMIDLIYSSRGRVIIAGIGKSGLIGRKIAATLNSTGTRAIFLHPVEAMHGDLGIVSSSDVFLAISNSGETDELNILLPSIRKTGCPIIAFCGNPHSTLSKMSDIVIDVGVEREACPLGLAPTASTTAQLAMGDAMAVVLIEKRKFSPEDFKKYHPGGNLGKRLSYKTADIMLTAGSVPKVTQETPMTEALLEMDAKRLGTVFIVDQHGTLVGIITDGDLRRMVVRGIPIKEKKAGELMTRSPKMISPDTPLYDALNLMEKHQITVLPAVDDNKRLLGVLHLHDILGKGALTFSGV